MAEKGVEQLLAELQEAVVAATGRIGAMDLQVVDVEVDIKTTLERRGGGELDLRIVKIGGGVGSENVQTVSVSFTPVPVVPAAGLEGELVDALEVLGSAVNALERRFALSSATVELAFTTSADGKVSVVVSGEAKRAETHVARLKLAPL